MFFNSELDLRLTAGNQIDPINYPLANDAVYIPKTHLLSEALSFESTLNLHNIVLVQPSIYQNDNSCLLDALRILGPGHGRGVVAFDPNTIVAATLDEWHKLGVRGVRINLQSTGSQMDSDELVATLHQYANIIRPYNWVMQLYVPMATSVLLEGLIPKLGVKVCLDHFGSPSLSGKGSQYLQKKDPYLLPGFTSLANLLKQGDTYVKLSAPYRITTTSGFEDMEPVTMELLRIAGLTRAVFASDWPHTRFEGLDIIPYVEQLIKWCGEDEILLERVFRSNAEDLWSVERHRGVKSASKA